MRPDEFGGTSSAQTHPAIRCAAHHRPQPSRHARLMLRLPPCCTGIRSGEARRHQRASRRCGDEVSSGFTAGAHLLSSARSPERLQCCCPHVVMPLHCDAHHTPCPHESHLLPCCPQRQREPWLSRTAECLRAGCSDTPSNPVRRPPSPSAFGMTRAPHVASASLLGSLLHRHQKW